MHDIITVLKYEQSTKYEISNRYLANILKILKLKLESEYFITGPSSSGPLVCYGLFLPIILQLQRESEAFLAILEAAFSSGLPLNAAVSFSLSPGSLSLSRLSPMSSIRC